MSMVHSSPQQMEGRRPSLPEGAPSGQPDDIQGELEDECEECEEVYVSEAVQSEAEMPQLRQTPVTRVSKTVSMSSQRSIMAGVQRRIKLLEDLSNPESKTLQFMSESSSRSTAFDKRCTLGLPLLVTLLVCFAALSGGGGMLMVLGVFLNTKAPLTDEDISRLWVSCLAVFAVAMTSSLCLGLLLGRSLAEPLQGAAKLMQRFNRTSMVDCKVKELRRLGRRSRINEVKSFQAASADLLYSIEVFKRYLPETVVRDIVQGVDRARRLHVSRRPVTIMFSDIQDFTTISEELTHHNLLFLLTRYLSTMTRIADMYEGVVAEILGDGLLVFWNTPDDVDQHAAKACAAALAQCEALESLNSEFTAMGLPHLAIRVGLHTGTVLTGNIGSERKMKFGCMGDPVNLASRLEGLCKNYGVNILCSDATHAELPEDNCFCTRQIDLVQVKGKNEPTRVYEVMGLDTSTNESDASADGPADEERGRHMKSFCKVALEAVSQSEDAMRGEEAKCENPFMRLLKPAVRRLSFSGQESRNSERSRHMDRSSSLPSPVGTQGSFSSFARGVSHSSRGDLRTRRTTPEARAYAARYEKALDLYQAASFKAARDLAQQCLADEPRDRAASLLLQHASRYIGPNDEVVGLTGEELKAWTGVTVMTEK